jgi:hypothetical protein
MRAVVIASFVLAATSAYAQPLDVSGNYNGTSGITSLRQLGDHVIGLYGRGHATIDGTIEGDTLRFTWTDGARTGRGVFAIAGNGALAGTWGNGEDDRDGGTWILTRVVTSPPVARVTVTGVPQSPPDPTVSFFAPTRRAWTFACRLSWDTSDRAGRIGLGLAGFGLDIERRVGARWHLGINGDLTETLAVNGMGAPSSYQRFRGGAALRRDLDEKRRRWVGVRGGIQTIDGGATTGQFAELAIGTDWYMAGISMGVYTFGGVDRERATATAMSPASIPRVTQPGDAMGWSAGLGMRIAR